MCQIHLFLIKGILPCHNGREYSNRATPKWSRSAMLIRLENFELLKRIVFEFDLFSLIRGPM